MPWLSPKYLSDSSRCGRDIATLNGPVSIVILAAEFSHCGTNGGRDKIFWCCLRPQSHWLQHLRLAHGLSGWRQGGVGLRDDENNGPSAWVSTISLLHSPRYSLFFSLQQIWPTNGSFVLWGENEHTHTHTHTHTQPKTNGTRFGIYLDFLDQGAPCVWYKKIYIFGF